MPLTRTCPRGHDWNGDAADCPHCNDDSWNHSAASTFRDELPPPPGSVRIAATPKPAAVEASPSSAFPVIPGYEVSGELGHGGMGTVYRARHVALNRLVALKVISAGSAADPRELVRFRAEAEAVAQLQHPNIVQIHEVGEASGRPYLALELIAGGTLASALNGKPLPARAAAELLETIANAVAYAHSQGVIHRDLKPGNILLQDDAAGAAFHASVRPKVVDFGLAKRVGGDASQTSTGVVVGTPSYMAPEQAAGLGKLIGPSCDIYALGAILYELLTGRPPFHAASAIDTLQQVVAVDPVPPARLQPNVPRDLETICLKCLQKESRRRYASAGDLADDLGRFLDGKPIHARRTPHWERAVKWARRRPAAAALVVVIVLAAGAFAGVAVRYYRTLDRHNRELSQAAIDLARERDEARKQSERAEVNLESANEAIEQMLKRVGIDRLADTPFMDRVRADLLEDALRFFDKLLAAQAGDPRLRMQQAHTLELAGRVEFALGRFDRARQRCDAALALMKELADESDGRIPEPTRKFLWALILNNRSLVLARLGELERARTDQEAALAVRQELLALDPTNPDHEYHVAASNLNRALIAHGARRPNEVALYLGRARPRAEALTRDHGDVARYWYLLGSVLNDSGVHALDVDDPQQAIAYFERGIDIWKKLLAIDKGDITYRTEHARSLTNLGTALRSRGFLRRAAEQLAAALRIREQLVREHPDAWPAVVGLAGTELQIAELERARDNRVTALAGYGRVIERLKEAGDRYKNDVLARSILSDAHIGIANLHGTAAEYAEMAEALWRALELAEAHRRADLRMTRALALAHAGRLDDAIKQAEDVLIAPEISAQVVFDAGRIFALAFRNDKDEKRKEEHAARAVKLLSRAETAGYFRPAAHRQHLDQHIDLQALRGRADFEALRAKVGRQ